MSERFIPTVHETLREYRSGRFPIDISYLNSVKDTVAGMVPHYRHLGIDMLPESEQPKFLASVLERIEAGTDYLHEYEEAGMVEGLKQNSNFIFSDAKVVWNSPESRAINAWGHYNHRSEMHIDVQAPDAAIILNSLAAYGEFPRSIVTTLHERIHAIQDPDHHIFNLHLGPIRKDIKIRDLSSFAASTELIEAQAHRMSGNPPHKVSQSEWVNYMRDCRTSGRAYTDTSDERLWYAVRAIDKMNALGFTLQEVAELTVDHGKWHRGKQVFPKIEDAIRERASSYGVSARDLDLLLEAHKIEKVIDQNRVLTIVRNEIQTVLEGKNENTKTKVSLEEIRRKLRNEPPQVEIRRVHP